MPNGGDEPPTDALEPHRVSCNAWKWNPELRSTFWTFEVHRNGLTLLLTIARLSWQCSYQPVFGRIAHAAYRL